MIRSEVNSRSGCDFCARERRPSGRHGSHTGAPIGSGNCYSHSCRELTSDQISATLILRIPHVVDVQILTDRLLELECTAMSIATNLSLTQERESGFACRGFVRPIFLHDQMHVKLWPKPTHPGSRAINSLFRGLRCTTPTTSPLKLHRSLGRLSLPARPCLEAPGVRSLPPLTRHRPGTCSRAYRACGTSTSMEPNRSPYELSLGRGLLACCLAINSEVAPQKGLCDTTTSFGEQTMRVTAYVHIFCISRCRHSNNRCHCSARSVRLSRRPHFREDVLAHSVASISCPACPSVRLCECRKRALSPARQLEMPTS